MNERDVIAAANAISDPADWTAFLDRECADRPELRQQIERLISLPIDSNELVERLARASAATLTSPPDLADAAPEPPSVAISPRVGATHGRPREPDFAEPKTFGSHLGEFLHRYRTGAIISGVTLLALVAAWMAYRPDELEKSAEIGSSGAVRSMYLDASTTESRGRNRAEAAAKETARIQAEKRQAVERRDQELIALRAIEPDVAKLNSRQRELSADERQYLESLVRRWRVFTERQGDDLQSRRLQADAHLRIASLLRILGRRSDAIVELRAACDLLGEMVVSDPSATAERTRLAGAHVSLGSLLSEVGRQKEALFEFKTAVDLQRRLSSEFPKDAANAKSLAATLDTLGSLFADLDEFEQSLGALREGVGIQKALADRFPDDPEFQKNLARMRGNLGLVLHHGGKSKEAIDECLVSLDLNKKLVERHPSDADHSDRLAKAHVNLATILDDSGRVEEALEQSRAARSVLQDLVRRRPSQAEHRRMLGDAHANVGDLLARLKREPEALKEHQEALEVFRRLAAEFPAAVACQEGLSLAQSNAGRLLVSLGRSDEALERYRAARDVRRRLVERFPGRVNYESELGRIHSELLGLLRRLGKTAEARSEFRAALALQEKVVEWHPGDARHCIDLSATRCEYASLLLDEGKAAESLLEFDRAVALLEPLAARIPPAPRSIERLRDCLWGRAKAHASLQRRSRALRDADRVVELAPENERRGIRAAIVNLRLKAGDVERAVADADEWTREESWSAVEWYNFACVYAAACSRLPDKRDHLAARAMELLQRASHAGYKDVAHIERDEDLDPLRPREDFKQWLANLQAATENSRIRQDFRK